MVADCGCGDGEIQIVAVLGEADLFEGVDIDGKHYYQSFFKLQTSFFTPSAFTACFGSKGDPIL